MKDMLKLVASLGLVCAIGGAALSWVHRTTAGPIAQAEARQLASSLALVLPKETERTEKVEGSIFHRALDKDGRIVGYAAQASGRGGFKGDVKVLVGLDPGGRIIGVMVADSSETPGIGSKATDRKEQKSLWDVLRGRAGGNPFPPNEYLDSYAGRQAMEFEYGGKGANGVHGVTGATYSSRAIMNGVNEVCRAFSELGQGGAGPREKGE